MANSIASSSKRSIASRKLVPEACKLRNLISKDHGPEMADQACLNGAIRFAAAIAGRVAALPGAGMEEFSEKLKEEFRLALGRVLPNVIQVHRESREQSD